MLPSIFLLHDGHHSEDDKKRDRHIEADQRRNREQDISPGGEAGSSISEEDPQNSRQDQGQNADFHSQQAP